MLGSAGAEGIGVNVGLGGQATGGGTTNVTITNNNIDQIRNSRGMIVSDNQDTTGGGPFPTICANITGNTFGASIAGQAGNGQVFRIRRLNGTVQIPQASQAAFEAANPGAAGKTSFSGTITFNGPVCTVSSAMNLQAPQGSDVQVAQNESSMQAGSVKRLIELATVGADVITAQSAALTRIQMTGEAATERQAPPPTADSVARNKTATTSSATEVKLNHAALNGATETSTSSTATVRHVAPPAPLNGETVNITIGTLAPGDSVTITFQVVIDNPYSGGPNVSNQGSVSGSNPGAFTNLTDDPAVGGSADPTLTPINSTNIFAGDGKAPEPPSGQAPLLFTITLSNPSPGGVSVNYATADQAPGAGHAVGGAVCGGAVDYITTNGTASFAAGQRVKTVSVPVCADPTAEPDETFLLNLSGAVGGTIQDNQAVGTITVNTPGTFLISELRTSGPAGAGDDYVELYNNTNSPLTVAASDASAGYGLFKQGADCNATPVLIATIPNGTVIPARGHYLVVGSAYSLANYGGAGNAAGNLTMSADIENDKDVAVFTTANIQNISTATRLDAVGFDANTGAVCDLLREGSTQPPVSGSTTEYAFFRKECDFVSGLGCSTPGTPKDVNDNSLDFMFADTQGTFIAGVPQRLGAPGPQNLASPRLQNNVSGLLLDTTKPSSAVPNRFRDLTSAPPNATFGTLQIRRRFQNNTGANVTRLRFRIVEITTFPASPGSADLRALSSANVSVGPIGDAVTCTAGGGGAPPCTITVKGTTLETPPAQPNGGGFNSTMADGTITLGTPLANGASTMVNFVLGVQTTGTFRFLIIVEALP